MSHLASDGEMSETLPRHQKRGREAPDVSKHPDVSNEMNPSDHNVGTTTRKNHGRMNKKHV